MENFENDIIYTFDKDYFQNLKKIIGFGKGDIKYIIIITILIVFIILSILILIFFFLKNVI